MTVGMLRAVGVAEAATGALVLARPASLLRAVDGGRRVGAPVVTVARVLGARMVGQGVLAAVAPSRRVALGGAATDFSHAASMVPVASRLPAQRRPALTSAAVALAFAVAQTLAALPPRPVVEEARP